MSTSFVSLLSGAMMWHTTLFWIEWPSLLINTRKIMKYKKNGIGKHSIHDNLICDLWVVVKIYISFKQEFSGSDCDRSPVNVSNKINGWERKWAYRPCHRRVSHICHLPDLVSCTTCMSRVCTRGEWRSAALQGKKIAVIPWHFPRLGSE